MTWMGDTVDAPMLLYFDEINVSTDGTAPASREEILVCRSQSGSVVWHYSDSSIIPDYNEETMQTIYQIRTLSESLLLRGENKSENSTQLINGLWTCRLSSDEISAVGLYERGMGE